MAQEKSGWGWEERVVLLGVVVGGLAFIVMGVVPALVYGGYAALALLAEITGAPVAASWGSQLFIVGGMALGFVAVGSLFAVGGAIFGLLGVAGGHILLGVGRLLHLVEKAPAEAAPVTTWTPTLPKGGTQDRAGR